MKKRLLYGILVLRYFDWVVGHRRRFSWDMPLAWLACVLPPIACVGRQDVETLPTCPRGFGSEALGQTRAFRFCCAHAKCHFSKGVSAFSSMSLAVVSSLRSAPSSARRRSASNEG